MDKVTNIFDHSKKINIIKKVSIKNIRWILQCAHM